MKNLIKLANKLDERGLFKEADIIDRIIIEASLLSSIKEWFSRKEMINAIMHGVVKSSNIGAMVKFLTTLSTSLFYLSQTSKPLMSLMELLSQSGFQLKLFIPIAIAYITKLMLEADKEDKTKLEKAKENLGKVESKL